MRRELNYTLYKGVSFRFNNLTNVTAQAAEVASMAGVKSMHPIGIHQMPQQEVPTAQSEGSGLLAKRGDSDADTWPTHITTQVNKLRDAGITGKGIRIGVLDVGVDWTHPALGGCFGSDECVVSFGYDLIGDDPNYSALNPDSVETPDSDPLDTCMGHGTFVTGVIAAQPNAEFGVIGAAADAHVGMYKVADCDGYYFSDVVVAGFNMAYDEGVDLISASLGNPSGWSEDVQAIAVQRIIEAGVPVISASANQGKYGLWLGSTPASALGAINAGSVDNSVLYNTITDGNDTTFESYPNNVTGGYLYNTTSWGPSWELDIITTVATPGGDVLCLFLTSSQGGYKVWSGTSFSAPLLASMVALYMQATGIRDPATIRNALSATAKANLFNDGYQTYDFFAPALQQGAGLAQIYDAIYTTSTLSRHSISFNDTDNFAAAQNFTLSNGGNESVTYTFGSVGAATAYTFADDSSALPMTFPNDMVTSYATIAFDESTVTLAAGESAVIGLTATPPADIDSGRLPVWSGWLTINGTDGAALTMPYMGVSGSMKGNAVIDTTGTWLGTSSDTTYAAVAAGQAFTLPAAGSNATADLPMLVVSMRLGSRLVDGYVLSAADDSVVATMTGFPLLNQPRRRLVDDIGVDLYPTWDGSLDDGSYAPAGSYKFLVKALRVFGDESVEADWDVVETDEFSITYSS